MATIQTNPTVRAGAIAVLVRSSEIYSVKENKPITAFIDNLRNKGYDSQMKDALTQAMLERQILEARLQNVTKAAKEVVQFTTTLDKILQSIHSYELSLVNDLLVNIVNISEEASKLLK